MGAKGRRRGAGAAPKRPPAPAPLLAQGFLWPWLWVAGAAALLLVGPFVVLFVYCLIRSWCFFRARLGRQEDIKVPHTAPVELYCCRAVLESQKVLCCLLEKGVEHLVHDLDVGMFGEHQHLSAEMLRMNPNGNSPFLVHEGHPVLGNWHQLLNYINLTFEGAVLVPETNEGLKELEAVLDVLADHLSPPVRVLSRPIAALLEKHLRLWPILVALWRHPNPATELVKLTTYFLRPSTSLTPELAKAAFKRLNGALDILQQRLADGREYLLGDSFSVVDISVGADLNRLDRLGLLEPVIGDSRRELQAYWQRLQARPSFGPAFRTASKEPGPQELESMLEKMREDMAKKGPVAVYGLDRKEQEEEEEET